MEKFLKYLIIILIINLIFSINVVNAATFNIGDMFTGTSTFISKAKESNYDNDISPVVMGIASLVLGIGVIAAIITGLIIAIKVMTDGAFGQAQLKEALTPYLIGLIVLFSAGAIWAMVVNILQ